MITFMFDNLEQIASNKRISRYDMNVCLWKKRSQCLFTVYECLVIIVIKSVDLHTRFLLKQIIETVNQLQNPRFPNTESIPCMHYIAVSKSVISSLSNLII